jgi:hypothetical protein
MRDKLMEMLVALESIGYAIADAGIKMGEDGYIPEAQRSGLISLLIMIACLLLTGKDDEAAMYSRKLVMCLVETGYLPNPASQDECDQSELN